MTINISRCLKIPTLPTVAIEVLRLFDDPNSSVDQIASVIRKDPAISSRLLKAANSSHYGNRDAITDVKRATTMLGRNSVAPLVLSFSLANQSSESSEHIPYFRQFWLRSFVQATAAEILGSYFSNPELKSECYTTSLLAGVGKLAILRAESQRYIPLLNRSEAEGIALTTLEQEEFGLTHHKMSSVMLGQIGLPSRCVAAILSLDRNASDRRPGDENEIRLMNITRTANSIASLLCDQTPAVSIIELEETLDDLQLPIEMTSEDLLCMIQDRVDATAELFEIDSHKIPPVSEILQDALEQLSRISLLASESEKAEEVPDTLLEENGRLKRRVADLLRASRVDLLTGAFNRAYLISQMSERAALHRVRGQSMGLAVVDIDHFKQINDTHGHQAGDQVLKLVVASLQQCIRDVDMLARYGGEEFVIVLNDVNQQILNIVGERLRRTISSLPIRIDGQAIPVTISIGLCQSMVNQDEQTFCERLFATADAAMYRAKHSGRNQFCIESFGGQSTSNANESCNLVSAACEPAATVV